MVPWTLQQLERYLKKTMPSNFDWQQDFIESGNLEIDHIIPKAAFRFQHYTDEGFQRCWALSNLRLFPAHKNRRKSDSLREYGPLFRNL
jgi:5-methylcytosine-specific restriction endonuclease McrA